MRNHRHRFVVYQTVTPLHVGCGQDVGLVDLPVIRERVTGYPYVPGSGLRGALRDRFPAERRSLFFGPEVEEGEGLRHAGCLSVHDAKILLFPVRSDRGLFVWLTCPAVLARLAQDLEVFAPGLGELEPPGQLRAVELGEEEALAPEELIAPGQALHLEEMAHRAADGEGATEARQALEAWGRAFGEISGAEGLGSRLVLVADPVFSYFVRFATVVEQHNRLSSAKTVQPGALFSLEAVPPEAYLYGFIGSSASRWPQEEDFPEPLTAEKALAEVVGELADSGTDPARTVLHLGGHESTGLGVTRCLWVPNPGGGDG